MSKLYTCVNCNKALQDPPLLVLEDGENRGLVLCDWQCMREHAEWEVDQREESVEQSS